MSIIRRTTLGIALALLLLVGARATSVPTAQAAPAHQVTDVTGFGLQLRADLELLADAILGFALRPEGWTANIDSTSATFVPNLWFDSELLATSVFDGPQRPPNWIGLTSPNPPILLRNVRHDLELTADEALGFSVRPEGYVGAPTVFRCDRTTLNTFALLTGEYSYAPTTPEDSAGYCVLLALELRQAVLDFNLDETDNATLDALLLAVRGDIERFANEVYGVNVRPEGWVGNTVEGSPRLAADAYEDLRILADEVIAPGERPVGFIGRLDNNKNITFRNLRFDVELVADAYFSGPATRPNGWQGADDLVRRCEPGVQDLVFLVEARYFFDRANVVFGDAYCERLAEAVNTLAENPPIELIQEVESEAAERALIAASNFAFSYLDVAATEYMGIMPGGTEFRAWFRNFGGSNMMFVSGNGFALYVDRRFTTLPIDVFDRLPTLQGVVPLTFCDAGWCDGPGPTPTPTGGALDSVLIVAGPQEDPAVGTPAPLEQKTQVNYENIRVTYLQENVAAGVAQVVLEICNGPAATATLCEPVISVIDEQLGAPRPVVSLFNGQPVFEFQYGYRRDLIIESASFVSFDIFISDPTIRGL